MKDGTERDEVERQHEKPCGDCPWRRASLPGWLGILTADQWIRHAHGESLIECHALEGPGGAPLQCAGSAIYRRNVCKSPRDRAILRLEADRMRVFDSPHDFKKHHEGE